MTFPGDGRQTPRLHLLASSSDNKVRLLGVIMSKRRMLIRLTTSVADLTAALGDEIDLTEEECLVIENHLLILQMAYTGWKRRRHHRGQKDRPHGVRKVSSRVYT